MWCIAAAAPHRPERAEDQPVHVEQRQRVGDDVVAGPLPRLGQRVEVGGERAPRQHRALRRPGGAGRVDDDRGRVLRRLGRQVTARARLEIHFDPVLHRRLDAGRREHELGSAVLEDVRELAAAGLRVDRRDRHPGQQRADDRHCDLGLVDRPRRHALAAVHALGDGGGRVAQLAVGQRPFAEPERDRVGRVRRVRRRARARSLSAGAALTPEAHADLHQAHERAVLLGEVDRLERAGLPPRVRVREARVPAAAVGGDVAAGAGSGRRGGAARPGTGARTGCARGPRRARASSTPSGR